MKVKPLTDEIVQASAVHASCLYLRSIILVSDLLVQLASKRFDLPPEFLFADAYGEPSLTNNLRPPSA